MGKVCSLATLLLFSAVLQGQLLIDDFSTPVHEGLVTGELQVYERKDSGKNIINNSRWIRIDQMGRSSRKPNPDRAGSAIGITRSENNWVAVRLSYGTRTEKPLNLDLLHYTFLAIEFNHYDDFQWLEIQFSNSKEHYVNWMSTLPEEFPQNDSLNPLIKIRLSDFSSFSQRDRLGKPAPVRYVDQIILTLALRIKNGKLQVPSKIWLE